MHEDRGVVRSLHYGSDGVNLFLRLDLANGADFAEVRFHTEAKSIALLSDPAVETARRNIFEASIPLAVLNARSAERLKFQVELMGQVLPLDVIPADGWIEISLSEPAC